MASSQQNKTSTVMRVLVDQHFLYPDEVKVLQHVSRDESITVHSFRHDMRSAIRTKVLALPLQNVETLTQALVVLLQRGEYAVVQEFTRHQPETTFPMFFSAIRTAMLQTERLVPGMAFAEIVATGDPHDFVYLMCQLIQRRELEAVARFIHGGTDVDPDVVKDAVRAFTDPDNYPTLVLLVRNIADEDPNRFYDYLEAYDTWHTDPVLERFRVLDAVLDEPDTKEAAMGFGTAERPLPLDFPTRKLFRSMVRTLRTEWPAEEWPFRWRDAARVLMHEELYQKSCLPEYRGTKWLTYRYPTLFAVVQIYRIHAGMQEAVMQADPRWTSPVPTHTGSFDLEYATLTEISQRLRSRAQADIAYQWKVYQELIVNMRLTDAPMEE